MADEPKQDGPSPPSGMADHADQLRPPIVRGEGVTDAERYLAKLGDKSFLNLWSYSSPHRDQRDNPDATQGKEICDLLVVCAPHIIIFSEKTLAWQADRPLDVAWPRWFRGAVWESVKQIRGAERWITEHPDRIFLDRECTTRLPLALPPVGERIIHRVVVAQGVSDAVRAHFGGGSGSLVIKPAIVGDRHFNTHIHGTSVKPFVIGDIGPNEPFVHVLDETALDIVMRELDTISDFTAYLQKKEAFIRSGRLAKAEGEENLMAYYAVRNNENDEHDFTHASGNAWPDGETLTIGRDEYANLTANAQHIAKKNADKQSYLIDGLIGVFTRPLMEGTSLVPEGFTFDFQKSEASIRWLALEPRFRRRILAKAIEEAWAEGRKRHRYFRAMMDETGSADGETAYFVLTLDYEDWMEKFGYEHYRKKRAELSTVYARALLMKRPELKRVLGFAMEPPGRGKGGSEEMIFGAQQDWTDAERKDNAEHCVQLDVFNQPLRETRYRAQEFPEVAMEIRLPDGGRRIFTEDDDPFAGLEELLNGRPNSDGPINRQQRRAAQREARKRKR